MEEQSLISTDEFCVSNNLEYSFISKLNEFGLITITTVEEKPFINVSELQQLEKITRLHYDLEINLEGIEAISHLLSRLDALTDEVNELKNRLRFYESEEE